MTSVLYLWKHIVKLEAQVYEITLTRKTSWGTCLYLPGLPPTRHTALHTKRKWAENAFHYQTNCVIMCERLCLN